MKTHAREAQAGLDGFIRFDKKTGFIGKASALAEKAAGPAIRLVTLVVDVADADVHHDEPIFHDGAGVGYVTSGARLHAGPLYDPAGSRIRS